ncbi:MAG: YHS domain-containing (seleno)protein [Acidobacteriota bacterium]
MILLRVITVLTVLIGLAAVTSFALAADPVNTGLFGNTAIKGYDPVSYFEEGKPAKGSKDFTTTWNGAIWRFTSAAHRNAFDADPERYAPQYGGYCAFAVAKGQTAGIDPESWKIVDGKLYLNYNQKIQTQWEEDFLSFISRANEEWPKILED